MIRIRPILFWLHLGTALAAGLVVLVMSVTGVALTYERQMYWWADTRGMEIVAPAGAERLGTQTLAVMAEDGREEAATSVTWRSDRTAPATVSFGRRETLYVDPYTGAVLGDGSERAAAILGGLRSWHRWLGQEGDGRAVGKAITGGSNLAFLFIVLSGLYLWWPRNWHPRAVRNVLFFRRGVSGKARDFNWHNTIGFWSAVPLAVVVASATVISYPWASDLAYRVVGDTPPTRGAPPVEAAYEEPIVAPVVGPALAVGTLEQIAEAQLPGWRTITRTIGEPGDAEVVFSIDAGTGGQPQHRSRLVLSAATGEVTSWEPFETQSAGRQLRSILRFAHTGEVAGLIGQTIAGLVSLGAVFLVWTGFALSWRRFVAWRGRRRRRADDRTVSPEREAITSA